MANSPAPGGGKDGATATPAVREDDALRKETFTAEVVDENRQVGAVGEFRLYSGPLPSPEVLKAYPQSVQDKIVDNFVQEGQYRREIGREVAGVQKTKQSNIYKLAARGQYLDFAALLLFLPVAVWLIHNGHNAWGGAVLGVVLLRVFAAGLKKIGSMLGGSPPRQNGGKDDSA